MTRTISALVLSSIILIAASAAKAQPLFHTVETLEWMAADSPVIVRATVADFAREVDDAGDVWDTVVVKVRETLKGRHKPFRTFVIENRVYRDDLPRWKETGQEILVFLARSDRLKRAVTRLKGALSGEQSEKLSLYELTPRFVSYGRQAVIELALREKSGGLVDAYTLDLRELTKPQDILQHTRAAVAATPKRKRVRSHLVRWSKMGVVILDRVVPIDARLEAAARRWARSERGGLREEGARALRHFPANENVAILMNLLDDPFDVTHVKVEDGRRIDTAREYPVRRAAFGSLRHLGTQVPRPVLRVRLPQLDADGRRTSPSCSKPHRTFPY